MMDFTEEMIEKIALGLHGTTKINSRREGDRF